MIKHIYAIGGVVRVELSPVLPIIVVDIRNEDIAKGVMGCHGSVEVRESWSTWCYQGDRGTRG
jgi:hypothetical protein